MRQERFRTLMDGVDYHPESQTLYVAAATARRMVYRSKVNDESFVVTAEVFRRVRKLHPALSIRQVVVKGGV